MNSEFNAVPGRRQRIATRVTFFIGGFAGAIWAPLVPYAKQRLGLDDGGLGLVLLCFGIGSISTMLLAGLAVGRFGCKWVIRFGVALACLALPLLATLNSLPFFVASLLLFGAAIGTIDVTVNTQAVIVEKESGRSLMSGFHAGWSIGGFAGSGLMTLLFALGLSPLVSTAIAAIAALCLHLASARGLLTRVQDPGKRERMRFPHGIVLAIGALCFISFLAEGSVMDWGAVFLSSSKGVTMATAGMGYMVFSVVMVACRLAGDAIVRKLGGARLLFVGGLIASAGFLVVVLAPSAWLSMLGFALIGLGVSNVVPVLFSLTGRQSVMPAHQAVSVVTTIAYTGILLGPAIIGGVAKASSLGWGLGLVAVLLLAISASSRLARK
jgi:Fucose permease